MEIARIDHESPLPSGRPSISSETTSKHEHDNASSAQEHDHEHTSMEEHKDEHSDEHSDGRPSDDHTDDDSNNDKADEEGLQGFKLWSVLIGLILTSYLVLLDTSILVTAIPSITTDFHSINDIGWYGAAYQLASASLQPLTGKFYANFNLKWTFIVFVALFELGSLLCGAANSSNMLIVGRAIAGMGVSGIQNGAFTIIAASVPMHRRPALIGLAMGVGQFGLVSGPLIGGALTQYSTWRWCFYLNLPCGAVVAALLCFIAIPEPFAKPKPLVVLRDIHNRADLVGFALFAPATVMFLLALQWGGSTYPWDSSVVIGLFVGSGVNAGVWMAWNWYKKDKAMIPLAMLAKRNVWSGCLTFGILMSTTVSTSYYLPIYFQSVKDATPIFSGVDMLPSIVSQLFGAVIAGKLVSKLGYYLPFSLFSAVLMSVGYGLLSTISPTTSTGEWIGYQIIFGFGRGTGAQMPLVAVQNTLPPALIPVGTALIMFFSTFGGAMFLSFADTIFNNSLSDLLSGALPEATAAKVIASGGVGFRSFLSPTEITTVVSAYATSVDRVFYMLIGLAGVCFFTAWGMGWVDIRKKRAPAPSEG